MEILRGYAEFWKIPYSLGIVGGNAEILLSAGRVPNAELLSNSSLVISPNGPDDAKRIADDFGLQVSRKKAEIGLPVSKDAKTILRTVAYQFTGPGTDSILRSDDTTVLYRVKGTRTHLLSVDLVGDYLRIMGGLEDSPSLRFRLATRLPFSYHAIPRSIRDRSLKSTTKSTVASPEILGPIECLRTIFLASLTIASTSPVPRIGFWRRGKTYALSVTHDVESKAGLEEGAGRLLEVERTFSIRSSWSIVTNRYPLSPGPLTVLTRDGEICAHDTKHDGRLLSLPFRAKLGRLKECRRLLEQSTKTNVLGFRSPLLQHNRDLVTAVGEAGYEFDSSVPSWEFLSPTSMSPHGVGTVFPFRVSGVLEMPVSLPQDHQLLRVGGLIPSEAVSEIIRYSSWIQGLGGHCVLLVHPDYDFGWEENREDYRRLLEGFSGDPECEIKTLGEIARWWASREEAYIEASNGGYIVRSRRKEVQLQEYELQSVTGYDHQNGFKWETLS